MEQNQNSRRESVQLFRAENPNFISRCNAPEKSAKTILARFNDAFDKIKAESRSN